MIIVMMQPMELTAYQRHFEAFYIHVVTFPTEYPSVAGNSFPATGSKVW